MFDYLIGLFSGLFWGLFVGGICGFGYKNIKNILKTYYYERNPKKILIKTIYEQLTDKVFEQFYNDIDSIIQTQNIKINELPDMNDIIILTKNMMEHCKFYNNKFMFVYDTKNNKTIKIKLLDNDMLDNKNFIQIMEFLNKNKIELCIIKNDIIINDIKKIE